MFTVEQCFMTHHDVIPPSTLPANTAHHHTNPACGGRTIQYPAGAQLPTGAATSTPPATGTTRRPATSNVAGLAVTILVAGTCTSSEGVKRQT